MDGATLLKTAADCSDELPGASLEHPFWEDWEVFKVRGKVFMLMTEVPGRPVVVLKSDPEEALALREQYENITPGYHMNKKHWITLDSAGALYEQLVRELVTESYRLVVAGLPKPRRPVDPHSLPPRSLTCVMAMSGEQLQDIARDTARALPRVTHGRSFTEQLDVYKVVGKVFLIITDDPDERIVTVKAEPEYGRLLEEQHTSITPGRYLDKRHWISLAAGPGITRELIADLVDDSYHLVLETVPRKRRPT